jgi:hypothetical protein
MKKTFVETGEFTEWVNEYMSDEALADLQRALLNNPESGSVMPGCGGLRKMRLADPRRGKGKRGGARVIYLHVAEADVIFLMDFYDKGEQADLSADQKKILKSLAPRFKRAAIQAARAFNKGTP